MNTRMIFTAVTLSLFFFSNSGCNYIVSQFQQDTSSEESDKPKRKKRVTKKEIEKEIEDCQEDLPLKVDEDLTLTRITLDYTGTINGWFRVSDDLTSKLRRVGNLKIEAKMRENVKNLDLDNAEVPDELKQILSQEDFAIQYIFEDRYGLSIASVVVSKETMDGDQRVGKTHENPFAVRNVSREGKDVENKDDEAKKNRKGKSEER